MKKFLHNIKDEASHLRLSEAEKSAMRAAIFGTASPVQLHPGPSMFGALFGYQARMTFAGLLLVMVAGMGTASAAAQNSLPGDALYPIKLSINEKVETLLAPDNAAKVAVQVRLAERRVDEAQTLSAQGRLDAATADTLSANFEAHAAEALALAGPEPEDTPAAPQAAMMMAPAAKVPSTEDRSLHGETRTMMMVASEAPAEDTATTSENATDTVLEKEAPASEPIIEVRTSLRATLQLKSELLKELRNKVLRYEQERAEERDR